MRSWAVVKAFYEITKLDENTDEDEQNKRLQKSVKAWMRVKRIKIKEKTQHT